MTSARKFFPTSRLISTVINSVLNFDYFHKININLCQLQESNVNWVIFCLLLVISKWKTWEKCFDIKHFFGPNIIKGYTCYEAMTFQKVLCEAQVKNFLLQRKVMFCSQDIQVFVFLTIPWLAKSVMSLWVLVHETECIFWIHSEFKNAQNSLSH